MVLSSMCYLLLTLLIIMHHMHQPLALFRFDLWITCYRDRLYPHDQFIVVI